jgi:hypothetical protein
MAVWDTLQSKKFLVRFGIGFGSALVAFGALVAAECFWLTSAERNSAQAALTAIDGLQNSDAFNDEEFDARAQAVQNSVEAARETARTARDQQVAFALIQYLGSIEAEREAMRTHGLAQEEFAAPESVTSRTLGLKLHETLD